MKSKISKKWENWYSKYRKNNVVTLSPETHNGEYALVSYLTAPFTSNEPITNHTHTNLIECKTVVEFFLKAGYIVDIINWDNDSFIPSCQYSVFFDIHSNIDRLNSFFSEKTKKILYATGAHWLFQNLAEYKRLEAVNRRRGVSLIPRRQTQPCYSAEKSDHIIILGEQTAYQSFFYAKKPMHAVNLFSILKMGKNNEKNFLKARNNYLWIGNAGLVHKGLDLVLETFSQMPLHHLYICGDISHERDFEEEFFHELYEMPNIHTIGWIDIHSPRFMELLDTCIGLVYPSCSEGQSGSVITCMHGGLIPIISRNCGVEIHDSGLILSNCSVGEIQNAISTVSLMDITELKTRSHKAKTIIALNHSLENYTNSICSILHSIIHTDN